MINAQVSCKKRVNGRTRSIVNPKSLPVDLHPIRSLDLDITVDCNLDCDYCFKEKYKKHMSLEVAKQAVIWLIMASGDVKRLNCALIGGEPMIRFNMIKELIPFAKRRAYQQGKSIHFSMTTNSTVINSEILKFFKDWGIGFHTSIDGCPIAHDYHRRFSNGKGSSNILAKNIPRILAIRPQTTGRATVLPDTVEYLSESFEYLLKLGYQSIAFVPGEFHLWNEKAVSNLEVQLKLIMSRVIDLFRQKKHITLKYLDEGCKSLADGDIGTANMPNCGAGRGMVLVDVNGNIWPCHRWNKKCHFNWRFGSIFGETFNYTARNKFYEYVPLKKPLCQNCSANLICSGGCPAENLEDTGFVWKQHPMACQIMIKIACLVKEFHDKLFSEKNKHFFQHYYHKNCKKLSK